MFGAPVVKPVSALTFPKGSVLHYFSPESIEMGPPATLYHVNELEKIPRVRHHWTLPEDGTIGLPIEIKQDLKESILSYHRKWKSLGRFKTKALVDQDPKVLMIENYAPILKKYRYNERVNLWYDIAHNQLNTVVKGLKSSIEDYPARQHYLPVTLPNVLPGKQKLEKMVMSQTKQVWGDLGSYAMLLLVQLYGWVGENETRASSIFSEFTQRELQHVNIIFEFKGNFVNINLGELDGWRREGKKGKVLPIEMQKRLRETIRSILETPPISVKGKIDPENGTVELDSEIYGEDVDIQEDDESIEKEITEFEERTKDVNENEDVVIEETLGDDAPIDRHADDSLDTIINRELEHIRHVSPKRYERFLEKYEAVPTLESPYGGSYAENLVITPEEHAIEPKEFIRDDKRFTVRTWNQSRTKQYGQQYCEKVLKKDVVRMCNGAQKLGFIIDSHEMSEKLTVAGHKEEHKLRVTLLADGKQATAPFVIPKVDKDGYWTSNGVKYTMRKQRVDLPIRKVGPTEVALTSFYGKSFVQTSEKAVANWGLWTQNQIRLLGEDNDNTVINNVSYTNVFDHEAVLPREYSTIAMEIASFDSNGYHYNFDHKKIDTIFDVDTRERLAKEELIPVAKSRNSVLAMDMSSAMYELRDGKITPTERISKLIGLPVEKEPKEFTEVKVIMKYVPLGLMLGYYWGIEGLLKETKTRYEFVPPGEKVSGEGIALQLKEGRLEIFPKSRYEELIYNSFLRYKDQIKTLSLRDLNSKAAYPILLQKDKLGNEYITEFDLMEKGFIDPFHEDILRSMGEPTGFKALLLRANELMDLPHHPKEADIDSQHLLTHQRIAGHLYKEMVAAMRRYHNSPPSTRKFDLKPRAVWQAIESDTSVLGAQEANAIQSIKEADVVTFGGTNGRSRRSMTRKTRIFNEKDLGIISGDTVDSTDVGITALLVNDANIVDITGRVKTTSDLNGLEHGQLLSFYNAIAPDVDVDDSKRGNFVGIQMGSAQSAKEGKCPPYRTPSQMITAHRASDSFAVSAKGDGKVTEVNDYGITVKFADGEEVSYPLGRWYGSYEGGTYPHDMVTFLKAGEKFTEGTILTYADNQFERDIMNPTQVNWKSGVMANVVLINAEEVFEDSDEIDVSLANKLTYLTTKTVEQLVGFNQNVMDLVSQGAKVDYDTILAIIDDSNDYSGYSESAIAALSEISSSSPKAEVKGYVDRIEVIYNGEYEEMSESVMALARKGDRQRRLKAKHSPVPMPVDGRVDEDYRVNGNPLKEGQMLIRFYITHESAPGGGSKVVVANQMKSVIRGRMVGLNFTDDGEPIHMKFGREGVDNRIVGSLYHIGLKNLFCWGVGKECRAMRDA
jgi:hypothetical protein